MPRRRPRPNTSKSDSRRITDLIIEAGWLVGLVSVTLAFNPRNWLTFYNDPKYVALHVVALVIIATWVWERAVYPETAGLPGFSDARRWLGRRPERWALVAGGAFAVTAVLSTITSPVRYVSLWGRDFTDLGYELYSFLSLLVIFFAVAMRMRKESQIRRLLLTFAGVGTTVALYAIGQRFNWDPLGPGDGVGRVFGSFGNPILLGSFLLMTAVITPAVAMAEDRGARYWWLLGGAIALGVQLVALWYTGSRGPWIGYAAGLLVFVGAGLVWMDRRSLIRGLALVIGGIVIAIVIAQIPLPEDSANSGRNLADIGGVFDDAPGGSIGGRGIIWESVFDLSLDRSWSPEEPSGAGVVRSLLGYGPEMFFYAYPLGIEIERTGTIAQHAHNYPLQILVELGFLGLGSLIAVLLLAMYAGIRLLNLLKRTGNEHRWASIILIGLLAALAGRGVEQMAGVARVGDLVPFWMLLGLLIAIVEITRSRTEERSANPGPGRVAPRRQAGTTGYVYIAIALIVTLIAAGLLYFRDVRAIQASSTAQDAFALRVDGRPNEALVKYQRAVDLNPAVERFHLEINDLFRDAAIVAESSGDDDVARLGWQSALDAARRYANLNPKAFNTQARIGQAESRLVGLDRDDLFEQARVTYIEFAEARPSFPGVQSSAAEGLLAVGDDVLGLHYADRAIAMETTAYPDPRSWRYRGIALENLGELELAAAAYETVIDRSPESDLALFSHRRLVIVYRSIGDLEKAAAQQALVDQFE